MAGRLGVPLRACDPNIGYCGKFYGQTRDGTSVPGIVSVAGLRRILAELPPGTTEVACHPGYAADLDTMYRHERALEIEVLCDPAIRAAIDELDIRLCSFGDLRAEAIRMA